MESSPSKRRRISPTTSIPADATTTPSRIPVRKENTQVLPHRPSFASPTKASIARYNPQLLDRLSSGGSIRSGNRSRNLDDVFAHALSQKKSGPEQRDVISAGEHGTKTQDSTIVTKGIAKGDGNTIANAQPQARRSLSTGGALSAKPKRMSRSPAKQTPKVGNLAGAHTDIDPGFEKIANPFQRGGLRRSQIASDAAEGLETDGIDPFQRRGLRRSPRISPTAARKVPNSEEVGVQETSRSPLASTKASLRHETTVSTTSPKQIIQHITSQSANSDVTLPNDPLIEAAEDHLPSSLPPAVSQIRQHEEPELPPLPKPLTVSEPVSKAPSIGIHDIFSSRARRSKGLAQKLGSSSPIKSNLSHTSEPFKVEKSAQRMDHELDNSQSHKPKRRKSARFSIAQDPYEAKKKARDELLKELQSLQADVALANRENERLRLHYESRKPPPAVPPNSDELLSLFMRATAPEPPAKVDEAPSSAFKSIGSFLPFSSRRNRKSKKLPTNDKPIPSHLPIAVDNPLPYLQAFSPLTYTSKITLLPTDSQAPESSSDISSQGTQSISQLHLITASHFSGLFTARLSMAVNTSLLAITSVNVETLPQSAEKELGTFLRERLTQDGALTKDIGLVCWAMSRWVEVSVLRARFWCAVEDELGTPEARAKNLQRTKKRKRRQLVANDEDEGAGPLDGHEEEEFRKQKWTRRELLPHMGRMAMELATDKVELRLEWKIKFDWTGEADSSITASVRLPKSWQESDDRKSLLKVPESFAKLVKQKGPLAAVRTVVGLLMPEP